MTGYSCDRLRLGFASSLAISAADFPTFSSSCAPTAPIADTALICTINSAEWTPDKYALPNFSVSPLPKAVSGVIPSGNSPLITTPCTTNTTLVMFHLLSGSAYRTLFGSQVSA